MKMKHTLGLAALLLAAETTSHAQTKSKASDVKPIPEAEQEKLNRAIGNEDDAKIRIAPIGQSDKDNVNKAVKWVEDKLKIRPAKKGSGEGAAAKAATDAAD